MGTPQAIYELSRAYGEAQSAIDRVCLKLDEMNIKPCELLEILILSKNADVPHIGLGNAKSGGEVI